MPIVDLAPPRGPSTLSFVPRGGAACGRAARPASGAWSTAAGVKWSGRYCAAPVQQAGVGRCGRLACVAPGRAATASSSSKHASAPIAAERVGRPVAGVGQAVVRVVHVHRRRLLRSAPSAAIAGLAASCVEPLEDVLAVLVRPGTSSTTISANCANSSPDLLDGDHVGASRGEVVRVAAVPGPRPPPASIAPSWPRCWMFFR